MLITAKSTPDTEIDEKINKGFNLIEIQLLNERVEDSDYEDVISKNIDVVSVHTPLLKNMDVEINHIFNSVQYNMFFDTCIIAQKYAEFYGHEVIVVLHNGLSKANWQDNHILIIKLAEMFKKITEQFTLLKFAIENTTPYASINSSEGTEIEDVAYVAKELNCILNTDKFGIVLDTCHLMMTKRCKEACLHDYPEYCVTKTFEESFKELRGLLFIMHLNNCKGMGCKKDHGTPFDYENPDDLIVLKDIMKQYMKYGNEAIICLEVREDDYYDCVNLVKTYESLLITLDELEYNDFIIR